MAKKSKAQFATRRDGKHPKLMAKKSKARLQRDVMGSIPRAQYDDAQIRVMRELKRLRPGATELELVTWVENMPHAERVKLSDFIVKKLGAS